MNAQMRIASAWCRLACVCLCLFLLLPMAYAQTAPETVRQVVYISSDRYGVLDDSGTLYLWGANDYGQRGTDSELSPDRPNAALDGVRDFALSTVATYAIRENGDLYAFGGYRRTEGLNATSYIYDAQATKLLDHVQSVTATDGGAAAITEDGTLYMCGYAYAGQLGVDTITAFYQNEFVPVLEDVQSVSLGTSCTAAISRDGKLYAWGQLGKFSDAEEEIVRTPQHLIDHVREVCAQSDTLLFLTEDGGVYTWQNGMAVPLELGNSELANSQLAKTEQIAACNGTYAALTSDHTLYLWGRNDSGQVGNGGTNGRNAPFPALEQVASFSLGSGWCGAVTTYGELYVWGGGLSTHPEKVLQADCRAVYCGVGGFCTVRDGDGALLAYLPSAQSQIGTCSAYYPTLTPVLESEPVRTFDNTIHINFNISNPDNSINNNLIVNNIDNNINNNNINSRREAQSGLVNGQWTWQLDDDGTLTVSGTGMMQGLDWDPDWQACKRAAKQLIVEPGVTVIGIGAFSDCPQLEAVSLPDTLQELQTMAFASCPMLSEVQLPGSVTTLSFAAFQDCTGLRRVVLPAALTTLTDTKGYGNPQLEEIAVEEGNRVYCSVDGVLFDREMHTLLHFPSAHPDTIYTVPEGVTRIENSAFAYASQLTRVVLPESLLSIADSAFYGCAALDTVELPAGLQSLGQYVFAESGLSRIQLPASLEKIGEDTCRACKKLQTASIESLEALPDGMFSDCVALETISLPAQLRAIGNRAFYNCQSLVELEIPDRCETIGYEALRDCIRLRTLHLPSALTVLGSGVCAGCKLLREVSIPGSAGFVSYGAFSGCSALQSVIFGAGVESIESRAFAGCSALTDIQWPGRMRKICDFAFTDCTALQDLYLPKALAFLGHHSFSSCTSLQTLSLPGSLQAVSWEVFDTDLPSVRYAGTATRWQQVRLGYGNTSLQTQPETLAVVRTNQAIEVDGQTVEAEVYNIQGANYFKLRDLAMLLCDTPAAFSILYDSDTQAIHAYPGQAYEPVGGELDAAAADQSATCVGSAQILFIQEEVVSPEAYNIGGNNFFKLRDMGTLLHFGVDYDSVTRTVLIDSDETASDETA